MSFTGFPPEGLSFLTTLGTKNKAWFDDNRAAYTKSVAQPAKDFVTALGEDIQESISPDIQASPKTNGSIGPINNDLRFSPDASPYKDHLLFRFWEGSSKKTVPTLFVRLSPADGIGFASGMMFADVQTWREAVASERYGPRLQTTINDLAQTTGAEVAGQELKRVPKPFESDHPRAELLKHKMIQVRWVKPLPQSISSPEFTDWCAEELERASKLHHLLVEILRSSAG